MRAEHLCDVAGRRLAAQLPDLVFGCFAQVVPERIPAESAAGPFRLSVQMPSGAKFDAGPPLVAIHVEGGGMGARACLDGLSATIFPSGLRCSHVEVTEAAAPLLVRRKELRCDSGGPGRNRGGLGLRLELEASFAGVEMHLLPNFGDMPLGPAGRGGGFAGASSEVKLSDGTWLKPATMHRVPAGVSVVMDTAGGGGYGPPSERPRDAVRDDLLNALISEDSAIRLYGWDSEATPGA